MGLFIRPAEARDRAALFEICLVTADAGEDATALYSDPDYPGLVWSVPYLDFAPAHCFVVDDGGEAVGFVVGTPDTIAFEAALEQSWWPELRRRYAGRRPEKPLDKGVLDYIAMPPRFDAALVAKYPAHLHINLLVPARSGGWGRRLIEAELASLQAAGASAVHLGVAARNLKAIGFYEHVGFERLGAEGGGILYGRSLG